jgi:hypothetical protein
MLGTAVAKLFAERVLEMPFALPAEVIRTALNLPVKVKKVKPIKKAGVKPKAHKGMMTDLVAYNSKSVWWSIEAKGRFNTKAKIKSRWKQQARSLVNIAGVQPEASVVCLLRLGDGAQLVVEDPPPDNHEVRDAFPKERQRDLIRGYYRGFLTMARGTARSGSIKLDGDEDDGRRGFLTVPLLNELARFGLHSMVVEWLDTGMRSPFPRIRRPLRNGVSVGPDGFAVFLEPWAFERPLLLNQPTPA